MSKLIDVKADGSLSISIKSDLFKIVRKAQNTWYTNPKFSALMLLFLIIIDVRGFLQIADATMSTNSQNRFIIVSAFAVAFEIAPLYIGYAICLQSYDLGKSIHKKVFWLSLIAFLLGVIGNTAYRILTMDIAYRILAQDGMAYITSGVALPMTILMTLLPIITSLVNIVIGCLSFDPLLFDLLRISKKMHQLNAKKRALEGVLAEMIEENSSKDDLIKREEICYDSECKKIETERTRLLAYVITKTGKSL